MTHQVYTEVYVHGVHHGKILEQELHLVNLERIDRLLTVHSGIEILRHGVSRSKLVKIGCRGSLILH